MGTTVQPIKIREQWLQRLETLIDQSFDVLLQEKPATVKIPELLKMIELHARSGEQDSGLKTFWAHIDEIRKRKQAEETAAASARGEAEDRPGEAGHVSHASDSVAGGE